MATAEQYLIANKALSKVINDAINANCPEQFKWIVQENAAKIADIVNQGSRAVTDALITGDNP